MLQYNMTKETQLKLSKNEIRQLLDSLHSAYMSGIRTPEEFLNWLEGESNLYICRARENERKSAVTTKSIRARRMYVQVAKRLRKAARITRRIHTKAVANRSN